MRLHSPGHADMGIFVSSKHCPRYIGQSNRSIQHEKLELPASNFQVGVMVAFQSKFATMAEWSGFDSHT